MSLVNICRFILEHPFREKVFPGMFLGNILSCLTKCLDAGGLIVVDDGQGNVQGVLAGYPLNANTFYIEALIVDTNNKDVVRKMLECFNSKYKDFNIKATRYNVETEYKNTERLFDLIAKLSV